jgi:uncharacterized protein YraI
MRLAAFAVVLTLSLTGATTAAEYVAVTNAVAALRDAPNQSATQIGTVARGTKLSVDACFSQGAFCKVSGSGVAGFVAGSALTVDGQTTTVLAAEKAKANGVFRLGPQVVTHY